MLIAGKVTRCSAISSQRHLCHGSNIVTSPQSLRQNHRDIDHRRQTDPPDAFSYNTMISWILSSHRNHQVDLCLRRHMHMVAAAASACMELRRLSSAAGPLACNSRIEAYGRCGDPQSARQLFDRMPQRDTASWTTVRSEYFAAGQPEEALHVFNRMPEKNVASWTALITGHVRGGREEDAIHLFHAMVHGGRTLPNHFTFVTVLNACANLSAISLGKQLHGHVTRRRRSHGGFTYNSFVGNSLINMYAKCGDMRAAVAVFETMHERDVVAWNSILTGYAQHGMAMQAVEAFERMRRESSMAPTHVTFLSLLSACNHAGLVDEGWHYFCLMEDEYGLRPRREHYAAMVDLLGRNRRLEEAVRLVERMPGGGGRSDLRCWGSVLAACRLNGDTEFGRKAAELLFELEPGNVGRYVMLSNVYAAAGQWKRSVATRGLLRERGLTKEPACSWIELNNVRHTFVAGDRSHPRDSDIYLMLSWVSDQMS